MALKLTLWVQTMACGDRNDTLWMTRDCKINKLIKSHFATVFVPQLSIRTNKDVPVLKVSANKSFLLCSRCLFVLKKWFSLAYALESSNHFEASE